MTTATATKTTAEPAVTVRPLGNRIVVRVHDPVRVTPGGIHLAEAYQKERRKGTVLAVGKGKLKEDGTRVPMEVEVGNVVMWTQWGGTKAEEAGEDIVILSTDDVLGVLEGAG
jgi:chaperonin GroES